MSADPGPTCIRCGGPVGSAARFCPACGTPAELSSHTPTGTAPRPSPRVRSGSSGTAADPSSTPSPQGGRFVPGTVLGARYRVVGLLGKGGMGEVYRAEDLTLGLSVALKFLPEALAHDEDRLRRFYDEVRLARQITHSAVCRVHDIGESDGQVFLSMEYVDGESLASLVRRIGRLPPDKALELARQICAGLAAAHERGVLHRDLKPDNVMIDGQGKARLTDFGLAALEGVTGTDVRSGTPAYMSPEQLTGKEVTARSDIYSLGLVLYELVTGRRAFSGRALADLTRQHLEEQPESPSALVPELDPRVERAILRCLEKDPQRRPVSALVVAAALPGGDPLAAALAAGETPSPELVAASGVDEALRPAVAWGGLAFVLLALVLVPQLSRDLRLHQWIPYSRPPQVLEDRARDTIRSLGYEARADWDSGFLIDADYIRYVEGRDVRPERWEVLKRGQPPVIQFWYRESPRLLVPSSFDGDVARRNPPMNVTGMAMATVDTEGRLVEFEAVPAQRERDLAPEEPRWERLFLAAGLDIARFRPVNPEWTPPSYADSRAAWIGVYPKREDVEIRVEAAAHQGRPVSFRVLGEWTRPEREQALRWRPGQEAASRVSLALLLLTLVAATLLARRNVRAGRGDRVGARRLAGYAFALGTVSWALVAHHVADADEIGLAVRGLGLNLVVAAVVFVLYLAVEPWVRRRWPRTLVSWTRLLAGRFADPLVGRDVLVGAVVGSLLALLLPLSFRVPGWLGLPAPAPGVFNLGFHASWRSAASLILDYQVRAAASAVGLLLVLVLLRALLRRAWLAGLGLAAILALQQTLGVGVGAFMYPIHFLLLGLPVVVLLRFGLLAAAVSFYYVNLLLNLPLTADLTHWTGDSTLLALAVAAGLAVYGFRSALGGRPLLRSDLLGS